MNDRGYELQRENSKHSRRQRSVERRQPEPLVRRSATDFAGSAPNLIRHAISADPPGLLRTID